MRTAETVFTETLLKKWAADPAKRGNDYTDAGCRNLVIYIARDGVVTFTFRKRVKGAPSGRVFESLGTWSSAFGLAAARDACAVRRTELTKEGFKPKAEKKSVLDSIAMYEQARKNQDAQASRSGRPLPEKWAEHRERFKRIFAPLMARDVNTLHRHEFTDCMDAYGRTWAKNNGRDWDPRVLRPMMVCMMPMLRWYTKRFRLDPREIEDLVPPDYDSDTRYLLPGEWQACAPHVDALSEDCGLFERFILATCVRSETALGMTWDEIRWGQWQTWKDEAGAEHRALVWVPPRVRADGSSSMKGRKKAGGDKLPRRILLTGESIRILERLRAIWEANHELPEHAHWNGVFTERMVTRWRTARTDMQRGIERAAGTMPWDRMTLRHTHATYLQALGCPPRLVTMSMNHTPDKDGAASVTSVYAGADPARRFMSNDPLAELAPWHLRLHRLIRDIERGVQSHDLTLVQEGMRDGQGCRDMCDQYRIARHFIDVKPARLAVVA